MKEEKEAKVIGFNFENTYANLPEMFFTKKGPSHVKAPSLVKLNSSLAKELGLNIDALKSNEGVEILSGNKIPEGSIPLAQAYAGHQFGHFTLLGDGRALLLGEHITPKGERFDIQLKGSGRTPYSRGGDGKAALGPMLREYIISEAMHALNIPTTRSLAVTKTGEAVIRETYLKGAVLTRIASSHIRVGTFQYARNWGTAEDVKKLADYTLERHFKEIKYEENPYLYLLKEVIKRQAELIAKWQLVGFIHGVMNTDNMTISGETIDYGPCAFMDTYDPETVFSSIDIYGRYAYKNQPNMAVWNLARFAETLLPLLSTNKDESINLAEDALAEFGVIFKTNWTSGMRAKLGIFNEEDEDEELITNILNIMQKYKADYTNTFRALTIDDLNGLEIFNSEEFKEWYEMWQERLLRQDESKDLSKKLMKSSNPAIIPRNHRVEEALEAAEKGDYNVMDKLLDVLINPFEYSKAQEEYAKLPKPSSCRYKTYCGT